jgi:hypothetical protein
VFEFEVSSVRKPPKGLVCELLSDSDSLAQVVAKHPCAVVTHNIVVIVFGAHINANGSAALLIKRDDVAARLRAITISDLRYYKSGFCQLLYGVGYLHGLVSCLLRFGNRVAVVLM